jgi:hypothetical protein
MLAAAGLAYFLVLHPYVDAYLENFYLLIRTF